MSMGFGFYEACMNNHMNVVLFLMECGADIWNRGLEGACKGGGHKDIILLMIANGATNLNYGLEIACLQSNKELMLFMIRQGAKIDIRLHPLYKDDIFWLLQNGITEFGGYKKVVQDCRDWQNFARKEVSALIIDDLANLVISY